MTIDHEYYLQCWYFLNLAYQIDLHIISIFQCSQNNFGIILEFCLNYCIIYVHCLQCCWYMAIKGWLYYICFSIVHSFWRGFYVLSPAPSLTLYLSIYRYGYALERVSMNPVVWLCVKKRVSAKTKYLKIGIELSFHYPITYIVQCLYVP